MLLTAVVLWYRYLRGPARKQERSVFISTVLLIEVASFLCGALVMFVTFEVWNGV